MARILLGWELGDGLGHASLLLAVARELKARGHTCVLVFANLETTGLLWRESGMEVLQAPRWQERPANPSLPQPDTLADIFMLAGYGDVAAARRNAEDWECLLAVSKADAAIAEYAPTLALAAKGRVPVLGLGTGFSLPPKGRKLAPVRFWQEELRAESIEAEARLLEQMNAYRASSYGFFADIFHGDASLVCCLPELDPYGGQRDASERYIGRPAKPVQASSAAPAGGFAYLAAGEMRIREILRGLHGSGMPWEAYVRHAKDYGLGSEGRVVMHDAPQPLEKILPAKAVFAHHGGQSGTDTGLRAGVPQLILARNLEQLVTGRLVERMGLGRCLPLRISEQSTVAEIAKHAGKLAETPVVRKRCAAKAAALAAVKNDTIQEIVQAAEGLLPQANDKGRRSSGR